MGIITFLAESIFCGPNKEVEIGGEVVNIIRVLYNGIKIGVPIILIIVGMGKAVVAKKDEDIKKAQNIFIKQIVAAVIVFLMFQLVQILVGAIGVKEESNWACVKEILTGKSSEPVSEPSDGSSDGGSPSDDESHTNTRLVDCWREGYDVCNLSNEQNPISLPTDNPIEAQTAIVKLNSDTLKVSIEDKGDYYITRVWAYDPYNQLKKSMSEWGKSLELPAKLLINDAKRNDLKNKVVILINGSGFYSGGLFGFKPSGWNCSEKYENTSEGGLVIYNGEVKGYRPNCVDTNRPYATTFAINKEGYLDVYYNYNKMSESARKSLFDQIVFKNYSNTWTFGPLIMLDGSMVSLDILGDFLNEKAFRNVICQINRNNFAFISSKNPNETYKNLYSKTKGLNKNDLKSILINLSCQTAINLDGGGSTTLLYKAANSTEIRGLLDGSGKNNSGNYRAVSDILYFTER